MGRTYESITDELRAFVEAQHMFFVATAPLSTAGHVNLSPKGITDFRVLGPQRVAYLDLTGSGNETSAHLHENGRITIMFCAFEGPPRILRFYGLGRVALPGSAAWAELAPLFGSYPGARQIVTVDVERVQTSCGFGVPLFAYDGQRDQLIRWAESKGDEGLERYREEKNSCSIDGLPAPLAVPQQ
jgi:hypothetical protein